jgi:hypothetical protein
MRRIATAAVIIVAVLAVAGFAFAESQPPDPTLGGSPAVTAAGKARGILKGVVHGDLLVRNSDGTTRTVVLDRGKVSSISEGSLTVTRPDGPSVSFALTGSTTFTGKPRDQLQAGMPVIVISAGGTAERVLSKGAARARACGADGSAAARRPKLCSRLGQGTN